MCNGGRITHHFKHRTSNIEHRIWDSRNTLIFFVFQAVGTLERRLADGAQRIKIFGE
jgi:metallo-beta-lactamase family protein